MPENHPKPLICVCVTAYNIEKYIRACFDSILSQKTEYPLQIVVGEDCSTDNTPSILREYEEKYPGIFNIEFNRENMGMINNFQKTLNRCNGKYIAVMDGDDVWTNEHKLQTQVDFLEQHPDYVLTFHNALICDSIMNETSTYQKKYPERYELFKNDIPVSQDQIIQWRGILGATSSIVFRKSFDYFPDWIRGLYGLEPMLFTLLHPFGKYKYFDQVMSSYRIHHNSTDRSYTAIRKATRDIGEYKTYQKYFYPVGFSFYQKKILHNRKYLVFKLLGNGEVFRALRHTFIFLNDLLRLFAYKLQVK